MFHNAYPGLTRLHWLCIKERIQFKILLLAFKAMKHGPSYLNEELVHYTPRRHLRSARQNLLLIPDTCLRIGERGFSHSAPKLFNNLPGHLRHYESITLFKSHLKTHLFTLSYNM